MNKNEGGQAEVVWTCHEEKPEVCRKKGDGNEVTGKEEKREAEEKISGCKEGGYGEVGDMEGYGEEGGRRRKKEDMGKLVRGRKQDVVENIIRCGNP